MKAAHLNDDQFAEALAGCFSPDAAAHVAECERCHAELGRVQGALGGVQQWTRAAAERPAGFWYAQRQAISVQLGAQPQQSHLLAWAGALAVLVLAAVLMGQISVAPGAGAGGEGVNSAGEAPVDPDDALMAEIQASVRRPVPRAFEPALLVTQELHRAAEATESRP